MTKYGPDMLIVLGAMLAVAGLALIYIPAAFIAAGALIASLGWLTSKR